MPSAKRNRYELTVHLRGPKNKIAKSYVIPCFKSEGFNPRINIQAHHGPKDQLIVVYISLILTDQHHINDYVSSIMKRLIKEDLYMTNIYVEKVNITDQMMVKL